YQLLTSTRYDPFLATQGWNDDDRGPSPFFLLRSHLERLISSAETHNWVYAVSVLKYGTLKGCCVDAISEQRIRGSTSAAFRLRITVSAEGIIAATATPLPAQFTVDPMHLSVASPPIAPPPTFNIYLDRLPVKPSVFTRTKTTFRDVYDQVKVRNEDQWVSSADEGIGWDVLMYNTDEQIMEATIFNVAFYRDGKWTTPSAKTGCVPGVMRKWLLDNGRIQEDLEELLTPDSLHDGELVLLFNGVQGCRLGKL
ncbi:D-aminoacid aminotransferase-like PLP-dependent enzyme, partial [Agrocybe pediades]